MFFGLNVLGLAPALTRAGCLILLCAGSVQAKPLASSPFESCGLQMAPPPDCPECQGEAVFEVEDHWHGLSECSRDLRDAWAHIGATQRLDLPGHPQLASFVRDQILSEMASPDVRFVRASDGRQLSFADSFDADLRPRTALSGVILINDRGEAYNGMGQTGMAYFLLQFAVQAGKGGYREARQDAAFYRFLGQAALAGVLTPVSEGGLTTSTACALAPGLRCNWYHSVTRRDLAGAAGGTLNQMLHVLRDMAQIDQMAQRQGWRLDLDLRGAVEAGLNQLFLSGGYHGPGTGPDLADFNSNGRASLAPTAWAYYGFNTLDRPPSQGYFLKNLNKNCSYHLHDLQLLLTVLQRARTADYARAARAAAYQDGESAAAFAAFTAVLDGFDARASRDPADLPAQIVCSAASRAKIPRLRADLAK